MSEWISCSDRLPNASGVYPACSMHPQRTFDSKTWVEMLYMFEVDARGRNETPWQHSSGFYDGAITHWMELPEPPK